MATKAEIVRKTRKKVAIKEAITQIYNPSTGNYIKRDNVTGIILEVKSDGKPFWGIPLEKTIIRANPNISKEIARKAEAAVIAVKNNKLKGLADARKVDIGI